MGLTPEEAAEFIPLCNELQRKKFEVGRACRHKHKHVRMSKIANKEISTDAYKEVMNACLESRIKEAELEKNIMPSSFRYYHLKSFISTKMLK